MMKGNQALVAAGFSLRRQTALLAVMALYLLSGCAAMTIGKTDLSSGKVPSFLRVGETTQQDVLTRLGEPLGYRDEGDRSAMTYEYVRDDYLWLVFGSYAQERAYRLYVVFKNSVLSKAEVQRDGWGFAGNVDPQLMQLLIR
jgi:hypothetical protein